MRIVVNGRFLTRRVTGVERYALEITRRLRAAPQHEVEVVCPRDVLDTAAAAELGAVVVGRRRGHPWEQLDLPRAARGRLLLDLCNTYPLATRRQLVALHDAGVFAVPDAYALAFRSWYRLLFRASRWRSLGIVTVSEFSRRELVRRAGVPRSAIAVAPPGTEHLVGRPRDPTILERTAPGRPYVLAVGSDSPHKNLGAVAAAARLLERPDFDIVMAGGSRHGVFRGVAQGADPPHLRRLGYVSDAELATLYDHAQAFVHPSRYEGFGIPPLEAMRLGCPVIVSTAASLPEVCGDAALYVDPSDPQDIARALERVMSDADLRADLKRRGRLRAEAFTWDASARAWLDAIDRFAGASRGPRASA